MDSGDWQLLQYEWPTRMSIEPESEGEQHRPIAGRGYRGVRITAPPRKSQAEESKLFDAGPGKSVKTGLPNEVTNDQRARILTGAALFGVLFIVLAHEFGHWLTGFIVTGRPPDFLVVAVRPKESDFSTIEGILIWGSGPVLHMALLWAAVLFTSAKIERYPRIMSATGAAAMFTVVIFVVTWMGAAFTGTDTWENDLPKVATFAGSTARIWMHLLSFLFIGATVVAIRRWWAAVKSTGRQGFYLSPAGLGAFQGAVFVLIANVFVALSL